MAELPTPAHHAQPAPLLRASAMATEAEMEPDGLFMLTLWLVDSPDYLAICRDLDGQSPERIWVEWQDQVTGHFVDGLEFALQAGELVVRLLGKQPFALPLPADVAARFAPHWAVDDTCRVDVSALDQAEIARVLQAIQDVA